MSYLASLLRGCGILQHVTARFSTVGYITQHAKGTRSKDIVLLTLAYILAKLKLAGVIVSDERCYGG